MLSLRTATPNQDAVIVQLTKYVHALTIKMKLKITTEDLILALILLSLLPRPP